ncbi:CRISPR-associated protein Cas4 [Paenibacillus ihbetae]|uniref:CRISPR-associated exonuclease Cas4 n=1 Tax=Paenibacillus ihbetae TaxID=1870820 RepID=A0ABX3JNW0_9BACL|nr:CRISPR-associated protein Cas4 [Paenibacillus ihbetae]OOC58514.1 CRISPR-associated protein Cas4 [Paenibacillus ihbetae]
MQGYSEDDYLMLSGIQHFRFCKRQWALIHIEQQWEENVKTVEGAYLHRKADQPMIREKRGERLVVRALPVQSRELGVTGICDVVEFVLDPSGVPIAGEEGLYLPVPVEYKRGRPKRNDSDHSQLVAQILCLEEMLCCEISKGYLFYEEIKRREEVIVADQDRERVRETFREMRMYFERNHTPKVKTGPHCQSCSLNQICLPEMLSKKSVSRFIESRLNE